MAGGSQKYEREIAEILERLEREEPRTERVKRQARRSVSRRRHLWRDRLSGWRGLGGRASGWTWIGLTLAAGIIGLVLHSVAPILGVIAAVIMVLLFFSPLLRQLGAPRGPSPATTWRGRNVVDYSPRGGFFASLRHRWRRFRARGGRHSRL